jgi:hypothetical protein
MCAEVEVLEVSLGDLRQLKMAVRWPHDLSTLCPFSIEYLKVQRFRLELAECSTVCPAC